MASISTPASLRPRLLSEEEKRRFDGRRSTFHRFPQYLFPSDASKLNDPTARLEIPYAYSHHQAAFYWTRQDALDAMIWNFPTRPPCLNCVLLGEAVAKRCDRMERQWRSQGHVRYCKHCDVRGHKEACVEMVEIRVSPQFVPLLPSGRVFRPRYNKYGVDMFLWTDEERALRKQGRVVWRPLNLDVGDVENKKKLAGKFAAQGVGDITHFSVSVQLLQREMSSSELRAWSVARRMMKRKIDRWDREEADPESEWASQLVGMTQVQARSASPHLKKGPEDNKDDQQLQDQAQLSAGIEAQRKSWEVAFREVRQEQYDRDIRELGTFEAQRNASRWNDVDEPKVMEGIRDFFEKKKWFLENGMYLDEDYACWESAKVLNRETRDLVEDFIPGMLLPVGTTDEVKMQ